jgi:hypothetical protein
MARVIPFDYHAVLHLPASAHDEDVADVENLRPTTDRSWGRQDLGIECEEKPSLASGFLKGNLQGVNQCLGFLFADALQ